jgi:hypothetical protein
MVKYACRAGKGGIPVTTRPEGFRQSILPDELKDEWYTRRFENRENRPVAVIMPNDVALVLAVKDVPYEHSRYTIAFKGETHMQFVYVTLHGVMGWCETGALSKIVL